MKLFRIYEPVPGDGIVTPGISITPSHTPAGFRWGERYVDGAREVQIVGLCKAQYKAMRAMIDAGFIEEDTPCVLRQADLADLGNRGLRFEVEKDRNDQRALVYVGTRTAAAEQPMRHGPRDAVHNAVTFTCGDPQRFVEGDGNFKFVRRAHPPFNEAVGVELLASELITEEGATWNEALLIMLPGSSFRIVRGGDIAGMVPEFLVVWTGHKLRTIIPQHYRGLTEAEATQAEA